jgi:hypothetical protein
VYTCHQRRGEERDGRLGRYRKHPNAFRLKGGEWAMADSFIIHWALRTIFSSIVFFLCGYILLCFSKSVLRAWPSLREMPWYVVVDLVCVVIFSIFFFYNSIASILSLFGPALPGNLTSLLYQW